MLVTLGSNAGTAGAAGDALGTWGAAGAYALAAAA